MTRRALITGTTGQDGSCLAELLLEKGYELHGKAPRVVVQHPACRPSLRRSARAQFEVPAALRDLSDALNLTRIVAEVEPDEVYNLGAQSHVVVSLEQPEYTADVVPAGCTAWCQKPRIGGDKAPAVKVGDVIVSVKCGISGLRR